MNNANEGARVNDFIDIVFDGPPGNESGRFIEIEDPTGKSIQLGEWIKRPDNTWALRIPGRRRQATVDLSRSTGSVSSPPVVAVTGYGELRYTHIPDNTDLVASEASEILSGTHFHRMCRIIKHRVSTRLEYLVEVGDGTREWTEAQERS